MKLVIYKNLKSRGLRKKLKLLLNKYEEESNYSFTSSFYEIDLLDLYIETFRIKKNEIYIITVENAEKELILFIPFLKKVFLNINLYFIIGGNKIDYTTFIYTREFLNKSREIINIIKNNIGYNYIIFLNSTCDENILKKMKENQKYNLSFINNKYGHILVDDFENNVSKKLKKEIIRLEKKLNSVGKLEFIQNAQFNASEKKETIDFIIKKKNQQYKKTKVSKLSNKSEMFYRNLINTNICSLSSLKLDNKIIAAHLGLFCNSTFTYLIPVYDQNFRKFSPGWILIFKLLKISQESSKTIFDLTIGNEGYKKRLNPIQGNIYDYVCTSNKVLYLLLKFRKFLIITKTNLHNFKIGSKK